MARLTLKERLNNKTVLLLDGAMGTELFARGLKAGASNDYANIESPDIVRAVHEDYFKAGSDAVLTNTFGASKFALALHGLSDKAGQINLAATKIAREAAGEAQYVLGDIGPSGQFLPPLGTITADELGAAFTEQAEALVAGGVDGLIIETMTALDEIEIAIEAAKSAAGDLPVFTSMSFDSAGDDFRTMMGVDVTSAVTKIISLGVDAVGFNCGKVSLDGYVALAEKIAAAVKSADANVALLAEPNAGLPEVIDGRTVYKVAPETFTEAIEKIHSAGFNITGGCCGTTPAHIKAVAQRFGQQAV